MLAYRMYGVNDIRLENVPVPEIGIDEILVEVKAAAVCGTDVRILQNGASNISEVSPLTLGHEVAGVICATGKNVELYKVGQKIAIAPNFGCGVCNACVSGNSHLCSGYKALGINMDGGFAEYVRVPAKAVASGNVTIIPDGVSFKAAAVNEPLSCAFNGSERCNIKPGETVVIIGAGPIGIMHAMLAKMAGAGKVIINDLSEERLQQCKEIDSDFITVSNNLKEYIYDITGGFGADVCITACPAPSAQTLALEICGLNGRINFFGGVPASKQPVGINTNLVHYKQLIISGTTRSSLNQFRKTLGFIADGLLDIDALVTHTYPLKNITAAFDNAAQAKGLKHVICKD